MHRIVSIIVTACLLQGCGPDSKPAAKPSSVTAPAKSSAPVQTETTSDFATAIAPILERSCFKCHNADNTEQFSGNLFLETREGLLRPSPTAPAASILAPGKPDSSTLYTRLLLPATDPLRMPPPAPNAEALTPAQVAIVRNWITAGAPWPESMRIGTPIPKRTDPREIELAARIAARITKSPALDFKDRDQEIPGTPVAFRLVAVRGGGFEMGSLDSEAGRTAAEGPRHKVAVNDFWMGEHEVTWDEYNCFMQATMADGGPSATDTRDDVRDALGRMDSLRSFPTRSYMPMDYGMSNGPVGAWPAVSMTHHAANRYCMWLSLKTGRFFRLPTEAEWEYACRAGSDTPYCFGSDASRLGEYAWYWENSEEKYQKVKLRKPNAWGLYDMHGNVGEWCLDQFAADAYARRAGLAPSAAAAPEPSTTAYPHVVRGGDFQSDPEALRSAARIGSEPSWKLQDPQRPRSIWYLTTPRVGFRVVSPLNTPSAEEMFKAWTNGVERQEESGAP